MNRRATENLLKSVGLAAVLVLVTSLTSVPLFAQNPATIQVSATVVNAGAAVSSQLSLARDAEQQQAVWESHQASNSQQVTTDRGVVRITMERPSATLQAASGLRAMRVRLEFAAN
jgi:cobalamin biosynthesis protein CobD/CbiB